MKTFITSLFFIFLVSACTDWKGKEVTITKDYVINPNWDEVDNSFTVYRMKLKDSSKTIDLKDPTEPELYHGLIKDTSFSYTANVEYNGKDYSKRKVYFDRDNGFVWRRPPNIDPSRNTTYETIGELQPETWYLLAGLSKVRTLYYVYLDNSDSLRVHKVSTMTNY